MGSGTDGVVRYRSVGVMKSAELINGKLDLETMEAECGFRKGSLKILSRPRISTAAFQPAVFARDHWGLSTLTLLDLEKNYDFGQYGIFKVSGEPKTAT